MTGPSGLRRAGNDRARVFASHQIGAALAATGAGLVRDVQGSDDLAWWVAGALCLGAAGLSVAIRPARLTAP